MFTGIVEEMGSVKSLRRERGAARLTVSASTVLGDAALGASICVNGVCLTVVEKGKAEFSYDVAVETLQVTNRGELKTGAKVNLELALQLSARGGGHLVSGEVDAVGTLNGPWKQAEFSGTLRHRDGARPASLVRGVLRGGRQPGRVVGSAAEHPSGEAPLEALHSEGSGRAAWEPQFLALAEQGEGADSAAEALRRCPHAVFVRPRHTLYREYSRHVWETVRGIVPTVEQTGIDEGYLGLGEVARDFLEGRVVAGAVQAAVRAGTAPAVSPDDGIAAMAAAEALVRAATTGEQVAL